MFRFMRRFLSGILLFSAPLVANTDALNEEWVRFDLSSYGEDEPHGLLLGVVKDEDGLRVLEARLVYDSIHFENLTEEEWQRVVADSISVPQTNAGNELADHEIVLPRRVSRVPPIFRWHTLWRRGFTAPRFRPYPTYGYPAYGYYYYPPYRPWR